MPRLKWIDLLKAIGIIAVVVGHVTKNDTLRIIIYSFHMPLFFFISGYLLNVSKYASNQLDFVWNRFKTTAMPYFFGCLFAFWYGERFAQEPIDNNVMWKAVLEASGHNFKTFNLPMWFLPCLFATAVVFGLIMFQTKRFPWYINAGIFLIIGLVGFNLIDRNVPHGQPWGVDLIPITLLFCYFGYLYRQFQDRIKYQTVLAAIALIIFVVGIEKNGRVDMFSRMFNHSFLFILTAISGIYLCIVAAKLLSSIRAAWLVRGMQEIGEKSLFILIFHPWAISMTVKYMGDVNERLGIKNFSMTDNYYWIVYLFIFNGILIPILLAIAIERNWLRWIFTGKRTAL